MSFSQSKTRRRAGSLKRGNFLGDSIRYSNELLTTCYENRKLNEVTWDHLYLNMAKPSLELKAFCHNFHRHWKKKRKYGPHYFKGLVYAPLMEHDPSDLRSFDPDPDHPKGTQPLVTFILNIWMLTLICILGSVILIKLMCWQNGALFLNVETFIQHSVRVFWSK